MTRIWIPIVAVAVVAPMTARADVPLACNPSVGKGAEIFVDGKPTGIIASNQPEKNAGDVTSYPLDASHMLMAWSAPGHYGRPDGSELYVVDCKAPKKIKTYAKGDFGHAVLLPDGKTLLYSDGDGRGIGLFELATKKTKGLTYPPTYKEGSSECDGREPGLHDIVTAVDLDSDLLEFERGGSCGFEGDWTSTPYFIDRVTTKPSKPRRGLPVATVTAGPGDALWATAAGACSRSATVWSSADLGVTWTRHAVPKAASGVDSVILDAKRPGYAIVETGTCNNNTPMGPTLTISRLHVTRDGGATWQLVMLPVKIPDDQLDTVAVASTDGSIDNLTLWGLDPDGTDDNGSKNTAMWTTIDAGARWKRAKKVLSVPSSPAKAKAQAGGATFEASHDGIIVRRGDKTSRIYPYRTN